MTNLSLPSHAPQPRALPSRQKGAILLIGMSILIVVTLFALAAIRGITAQERIAGGFYDREIAFAAAESALNYAERKFMLGDTTFESDILDADTADPVCIAGKCPNGVPDTADYFKDMGFADITGESAIHEIPGDKFSAKVGDYVSSAGGKPRYMIVKLKDGGECGNAVRINGIGFGRNQETITVLETIVCKPS